MVTQSNEKTLKNGYTLIETMVALAIGSFLSFGLIKLVGINRQITSLLTNERMLSTNSSLAVTLLKRLAQHAGHRSPVDPLFLGCYAKSKPDDSIILYFRNASSATTVEECSKEVFAKNQTTFALTGNPAQCLYEAQRYSEGKEGTAYALEPNVRLPNFTALFNTTSGMRRVNNNQCTLPSNNMSLYTLIGKNVTPAFSGTAGSENSTGDTLIIRYQGDSNSSMTDCFGNTVDENTIVTNSLTVTPVTLGDETINALVCRVQRDTTTASTGAITSSFQPSKTGWAPLVPYVDAIRVLYGIDTASADGIFGPDGVPNRYLPANQLTKTGPLNPASVSAVRVALLIRSPIDSANSREQSYSLLGHTHTYNDKSQRKIVTTTLFSADALPPYRLEKNIYTWYDDNSPWTNYGEYARIEVLATDWAGDSAVFVRPNVRHLWLNHYKPEVKTVRAETLPGGCTFAFHCETTTESNSTLQLQAILDVSDGTNVTSYGADGSPQVSNKVYYGDTKTKSELTNISCGGQTVSVGCKFRQGAERWSLDPMPPELP